MTNLISLALACAVGAFVGLVFFGGLRWTVSACTQSQRPAAIYMASFALRSAFALGTFGLVFGGSLMRLAGCLFGFTLARWMLIHYAMPLGRAVRENADAPDAR